MSTKRILGLSCGAAKGSAEILLKSALMAAEQLGQGVELIRLDGLHISSGPELTEQDDLPWLWERMMECDALIVSTPIYSRTIAGRLKLLTDRLLGPNADAAFIGELLRLRTEGKAPTVPFRVDERVLKPRVAGFIVVGGSLTPQWKTLALPLLHSFTFSMQIAVVDQVQFGGAGTPRSIVLDEEAITRAATLGRNVAEQAGRRFEETIYKGDKPGLCPLCHLDVFVLQEGGRVECATCGARGEFVVRDGETTVHVSDEGRLTSVITLHEKRDHFFEIQQTAQKHNAVREEIEKRAAAFDSFDREAQPSELRAEKASQ